jgi:hypothetical protein
MSLLVELAELAIKSTRQLSHNPPVLPANPPKSSPTLPDGCLGKACQILLQIR